MKHLSTLLFVCFGFAFASAQSSTTMQDILETVTAKVIDLEDEKHQEVVNMTFDLLVNEGTKKVYRFLDPSFGYTLVAFGDRRINRLRVSVYKQGKQDWEYVTELSGSSPEIKIYPSDFEQYEFTVSVDSFKGTNTTGHFALLLYHRNPEK
jgi:hypothetical protein